MGAIIANPYIMVAIVVSLAYWPLAAGWSVFTSDAIPYQIPEKTVIRQCLLLGRLPFMNPHILCGAPILPNIASGALYPLNFILLIGPPIYAFNLFLFLHFILAGLAMALLLRRGFDTSPAIAAIGGASFALSGCVHGSADKGFLVSAWLIPLFLLGVILVERSAYTTAENGRRNLIPSPAPALLAVAALTLLIFSGNFMEACSAVVLAGAGVLAHAYFRGNRSGQGKHFADSAKALAGYAATTVFAAALAAPQLIPTVLASKISYRAGGIPLEQASRWSFPPIRTIEFLIPGFFGTRDGSPLHFIFPENAYSATGPFGEASTPWFDFVFFGLPILCGCILAIYAALSKKNQTNTPGSEQISRETVAFLTGMAAFFILLAYGRHFPLHALCHALVPKFNVFRHPEKFLESANLIIIILGAYGLDRVVARGKKEGVAKLKNTAFLLVALLGMVAVIITLTAGMSSQGTFSEDTATRWRLLMISANLAVLGIITLASAFFERKQNLLTNTLLFLTTIHFLLIYHFSDWIIPTEKLKTAFAMNWVDTTSLPTDEHLHRVYADPKLAFHPRHLPSGTPLETDCLEQAATLAYNAPAVVGAKTPGGFSALTEKRYTDYFSFKKHPPNILMDILSVKNIAVPSKRISSGKTTLRNTNARPRFEAISDFIVARDPAEEEKLVFKLKRNAPYRLVVSKPPPPHATNLQKGKTPRNHNLKILDDSPGQAILKLSGGPAWIVFRDWKTPGWRCVNAKGEQLEIVRADAGLMAVFVPEKNMAVAFSYIPPGFKTGLIASILALAALLTTATLVYILQAIRPSPRTRT